MAKAAGEKTAKFDLKKAFVELHKSALKSAIGNLYLIILIAILSAIFGGFIVRWLGGYPKEEINAIKIPSPFGKLYRVTEGKIIRDEDGKKEKVLLAKTLDLEYKSTVYVSACAIGKFINMNEDKRNGLVEIKICIDEIEHAFNSSFLYKCEYQNENRALSSSTFTMEELDPGEHRITATAIYYGIIEAYKTKLIIHVGGIVEKPFGEVIEWKEKNHQPL